MWICETLQVLTFLRDDCKQNFGNQATSCFAVLTTQLEVILKMEHIPLPDRYVQHLLCAYPDTVVSGTPREFLRPGSNLTYIPGGRKARAKGAEHTVYRKALYIRKDALAPDITEYLSKGMP